MIRTYYLTRAFEIDNMKDELYSNIKCGVVDLYVRILKGNWKISQAIKLEDGIVMVKGRKAIQGKILILSFYLVPGD